MSKPYDFADSVNRKLEIAMRKANEEAERQRLEETEQPPEHDVAARISHRIAAAVLEKSMADTARLEDALRESEEQQ